MSKPWHKTASVYDLAAEAHEAWEYLTEHGVSHEGAKVEFGPAGGPYTPQPTEPHTLVWMLRALGDELERSRS